MNEPGPGDEDPERTAGREAAGDRKHRPQAAPVIALRMEGLLAWTVERVAKFPREHKFTVGDCLVETCLDITSHLIEASYRATSAATSRRRRAGSSGRGCWFARRASYVAYRKPAGQTGTRCQLDSSLDP